MKAQLRWLGPQLQFEGATESGKIVKLDSAKDKSAAIGPSPVELVLQALGGCTAMDVISILQKMRRTINALTLEIDADRREDEYPRIFTHIRILYQLVSPDVTETELERAIQLSEEKYCSVSGMLRPTVKITTAYELLRTGGNSHPDESEAN
jgi:putative redox protein